MIHKNNYYGISYPKFLRHKIILKLWRKLMCKRGRHLLDECWSLDDWCLSCDACDLEIHIDKIDDKYVR
uniref:Uncharacterized protein n=1 Tax=viral metagenome TaxID=1070528 RepID=A0A6M3J039_9ZZZZ